MGKKKGPSGLYKFILNNEQHHIHPSINIYSCFSLRHKGTNPNTMQIPSHGDSATVARVAYAPLTKHHAFFSLDYSSIQARLATIYSKDPELVKMYNTTGDMHLLTSYMYVKYMLPDLDTFEKCQAAYNSGPYDEEKNPNGYKNFKKLKTLRQAAKGINFGLIFGGSYSAIIPTVLSWGKEVIDDYVSAKHLDNDWFEEYQRALTGDSKDIASTLPDDDKRLRAKAVVVAKDAHKGFFELYKVLREWQLNQQKFATENGYSPTYFGTMRRTPYLLGPTQQSSSDVDGGRYANFKNTSLNTTAQTGEVLTITRAQVKARKRLKEEGLWLKEIKDEKGNIIDYKGSYIFAVIHDAIEVAVDLADENYKRVIQILCEEFNIDYPEYEVIHMESEGNLSPYWHDGTFWDMGDVVDPNNVFDVPNCDKKSGLPIKELQVEDYINQVKL